MHFAGAQERAAHPPGVYSWVCTEVSVFARSTNDRTIARGTIGPRILVLVVPVLVVCACSWVPCDSNVRPHSATLTRSGGLTRIVLELVTVHHGIGADIDAVHDDETGDEERRHGLGLKMLVAFVLGGLNLGLPYPSCR